MFYKKLCDKKRVTNKDKTFEDDSLTNRTKTNKSREMNSFIGIVFEPGD